MSAHIVLVEDDNSLRVMATLALETLGGYEVTAYPSGEAALAGAPAVAPDLLVLDVSMPGLDGPQTLRLMRATAELASTPAMFLTANTQAGQVAGYRELGVRDVIAKPFDPQHLCDRVAAALAPWRTAPAQPAATRSVLVVEDDPGVRYLLRFILEQDGWRVMEAVDGPDALRAIHKGEVADAVMLDIMLPHVDGLQLLDVLRASPRWSGVPVMMVTARGDEAAVKRALAAGADDYLAKPFDPAELAARLRRLPLRG